MNDWIKENVRGELLLCIQYFLIAACGTLFIGLYVWLMALVTEAGMEALCFPISMAFISPFVYVAWVARDND